MPGVGDIVAGIAKATGISALVGDCVGCDERRRKLNNLFSRKEIMPATPPTQTPVQDGPEQVYMQFSGSPLNLDPNGVRIGQGNMVAAEYIRATKDGTLPIRTRLQQRCALDLDHSPKEGDTPEVLKRKLADEKLSAAFAAAFQVWVNEIG